MGLFDNINFSKLKEGLSKTRNRLFNSITETVSGKAVIDNATLNEIEEILISSDIGLGTTESIIESVRMTLKSDKDRTTPNIIETVKKELTTILNNNYVTNGDKVAQFKPYVILVVGVNGVGKTTTIGKLAHNFKKAGLRVIVGAADTFRAAANEQLEIWAKRADVEIFMKDKGSDPSSVAFDTLQKAKKENYDVVIIDTAGRLHNKTNLMEELSKIRRVLNKMISYAPNETLLVLDGTSGQNAILQADEFIKVTDVNGLIITKLDGTAKGGVVFQVCAKQKIPVKYIGIGEGIDDLQTFNPELFVSALFESN
ncbi:MAG: signal recognition particle-docking protein FtsY [Ignavibacteria bacterium GWA2_35_9]|nr:MAG: signal recognition particle-docking protein FtsY [Ignavibacteria bacterium GWA2_35_9]OGU46404.1 MAG: signal recognition particle-docking protein FtsY [Ignavibacteria bacterium GWB2_36_8]